MNRRGFLGALAGFALDPERLLWVPGKKKIFIPPARPEVELWVIYGDFAFNTIPNQVSGRILWYRDKSTFKPATEEMYNWYLRNKQ